MLVLKSNSDIVKICLYYVMKSREPSQEIVHGLVGFTGGGIVASKSFILRSLKATGNSKLCSALNMQNHMLKISISIGRICHKVSRLARKFFFFLLFSFYLISFRFRRYINIINLTAHF